jgi:hypothetical protein
MNWWCVLNPFYWLGKLCWCLFFLIILPFLAGFTEGFD